ncbi:MAG: hypothetical protein JWN34_3100 [Bryobacterales bacterium]|nr:hypothetical protein [Bryobacterales bacterium]
MSSIAPPTRGAATDNPSRRKPPNKPPSMIDSWIAATMRPPPLSGSSLIPLDNQVDQHTGIAELSAPQAIMAIATPQNSYLTASNAKVTAAKAAGRPRNNE